MLELSGVLIDNYNGGTNAKLQNSLSKSDIFDVLRNDRRRYTLELLQRDGSKTLRDISEEIARMESGEENPSGKVRKSVYVSLLQNHLPKMEEMGLISYDREMDHLELTQVADNVSVYLETVEKGDISWSQYYTGISAIALTGGIITSQQIVEIINTTQWFFFISIIVLISSLIHQRHLTKLHHK